MRPRLRHPSIFACFKLIVEIDTCVVFRGDLEMLTAARQEIRDRLEVGPVCCLKVHSTHTPSSTTLDFAVGTKECAR